MSQPSRFDTRIVPDFLSNQEISTIVDTVETHGARTEVGSADNPSLHHAMILSFFLDQPVFSPIADILLPRLRQHFDTDLELDNSTHILESYSPYGIHSDVMTRGFEDFDLAGPRQAAWTFIIPVDTYDSHTLVFQQGFDDIKHPQAAIDAGVLLPHHEPRDTAVWQRYLSHCDPAHADYLTVEEIFSWQKGSLFAMDRKKFHVSDDFRVRGLACKRAVVAWSTVAKN